MARQVRAQSAAEPRPAGATDGGQAGGTHVQYPLLVGTLILCMALVAIDTTIVATALPTIVGDLGGFSRFSWVISLYLLTQTATVPVYGRLADLYGRRPVLLAGIVLFLVGSALSGAAHTMLQLILFRGLQGLGAGAVMPVTSTIIGDIYSLEQRAKMQGVFSSVWGVSAIVGPTLGGFLVQAFTWRLIFYINVPLGALAIGGLLVSYREAVSHKEHRIDYAGAALLLGGVSALLICVLGGGVSWAWGAWPSLAIGATALALLAALWRTEAGAAEPILPLRALAQRLIAVGDAGTLLAGGISIGLSSYLPTYIQGVMGRSATTAGLVLAAMSIGWPLASALSGTIMLRVGFRSTAVAGGVLASVGSIMLWRLQPGSPLYYPALSSFVIGCGMGLVTTTTVVAIQSNVPWRQRGMATSSNMFSRQLGQTVCVGVFGAVLNAGLLARLRLAGAAVTGAAALQGVSALLTPAGRARIGTAAVARLTSALAGGLHSVYGLSALLAIGTLFVLFAMPGGAATELREEDAGVQAGD